MEGVNNIPPLEGLVKLIRASGYEVVSIGGELDEFGWGKQRFTGVIDMRIAPATYFNRENFNGFPQISDGAICHLAHCRGCTAQCRQQENGTG